MRLQAEQRSFWDAPDTYAAMAPFNNAHKIDTPLLLIHGEADNNTGAAPPVYLPVPAAA